VQTSVVGVILIIPLKNAGPEILNGNTSETYINLVQDMYFIECNHKKSVIYLSV
jgi:hypothetical protein